MTMPPVLNLGPYELLSSLGAGGMGEVYVARDTRLNREVAIKVLPASFTTDAERLRRFEIEARAVGQLNHPNILTVHDFGLHDGAPYLVMELLEGEELRAQLQDGALPLRKAIDYALQIANGLAAAHAKGIVHRDLKPANLFVTTDGRVKILDFGLAKLRKRAGAKESRGEEESTLSLHPSIAPSPSTDPGVVMGTVGYMSPEQVRGEVADHHSDIFSFGVILYEMLSGQRAFQRDTMAETMTAILKDEPPDLSEANNKISPQLDKIVRRCLEKKPERRFQSASDLGFALETLTTPSGSQLSGAPIGTLPAKTNWLSREKLLLGATAFLALMALFFAWAYFTRKPIADNQTIRLAIPLPEKVGAVLPISISPDGQFVAFHAPDPKGVPMLWLRPLNAIEAKPLAGTEGVGNTHFWSPDSRFVAVVVGNKLKKISVSNGAAQVICQVNDVLRGGAWNRDGVILLGTLDQGLLRVTESDKTVRAFTELDLSRLEGSHRLPQFLPDGQHFLYRVTSARNETNGIYVGTLNGTERRRLLDGESNAFYAAPGWLLILRGRELMAQRFDADKLQIMGEPVRVGGQARDVNSRVGLAAAENGTLIYMTATGTSPLRLSLSWLDRSGAQTGSLKENFSLTSFSLSPDEKKLVIIQRNNQAAADSQVLFLLDLQTNTKSRFTFGETPAHMPHWSPDGSKIAWRVYQDGFWQVFQKSSGGMGEAELLFKSEQPVELTDWSPDGQFICYYARDPKANRDLWLLPVTGEHKPVQIFKSDTNEFQGRFAPDGKWLAYVSDESGSYEIYVRTFPDTGSKWQVSNGGGTQPRWRRDGKELFYVSTDRKLMALDVQTGATFTAGTPHALFDLPGRWEDFTSGYAVTKDGQRFLFPVNIEVGKTAPIEVVLNWTELLKK